VCIHQQRYGASGSGEFDVQIDMNDVRVDFFCSSGPGGQSVNTTKSAVRLHSNRFSGSMSGSKITT
jgi:protein subunit release factor B